MSKKIPTYGMYTREGDYAVHGVVVAARTLKLTWPMTYSLLKALALENSDRFGETLDTEVRASVYDAMKFETNFYI